MTYKEATKMRWSDHPTRSVKVLDLNPDMSITAHSLRIGNWAL